MLTRLGPAPAPPTDAVDLLLECHERIRAFSALVTRLATEPAPIEEVHHTAAAILRYFRESLPLHVEDEERSLLPRLTGREPALDSALLAMAAEHRVHDAVVREVVAECAALEHARTLRPERAAALGRAGGRLQALFLQHLGQEEALVFPAVRRLLPPEEQAAIMQELRARRTRPAPRGQTSR